MHQGALPLKGLTEQQLFGTTTIIFRYEQLKLELQYYFIIFRHILAVIHFNKNLNRDELQTQSGKSQVKVVYPKFKNGEATVRSVRVQQNFGKI